MTKIYQKHHSLEPASTPRLTEAVGIRLVWHKYQSKTEAAWFDDTFAYRQRVERRSDFAFARRRAFGFFVEGNIHQKNNNQKKHIHKSGVVCHFAYINHSFFDCSLKILASIKERIPRISLNVKKTGFFTDATCGSIKTNANQATETLTRNSDKISSQTGEKEYMVWLSVYKKVSMVSI